MIEKVEMWSTSDGKLHKTEQEATKHEDSLNFENWYCSEPIELNDSYHNGDVSFNDFKSWLTRMGTENLLILKEYIDTLIGSQDIHTSF